MRLLDFVQLTNFFEEDKVIEEIQEFNSNNNIFPLEVEESERLSSSPLSQLPQKSPNYSQPPPSLLLFNSFDMPSLSDEDLQRIPPLSPLNFYDFPSSLPTTDMH